LFSVAVWFFLSCWFVVFFRESDKKMVDAFDWRNRANALPSSNEIDILWITAGLGCDGDSVAMTAATQPSLEDIVLGGIPNIPKGHFHHPLLAYETGDEFMQRFALAAEGKVDPFILVIEGSIPNERSKQEGYWAGFGNVNG
jgi:hydrogenase small subunit